MEYELQAREHEYGTNAPSHEQVVKVERIAAGERILVGPFRDTV